MTTEELDTKALREKAEAEELTKLRDYAREATIFITGLAGGGSEFFAGNVGEVYLADLPFCKQRIAQRTESYARLAAAKVAASDDKIVTKIEAERDAALAEVARLTEALTPSAETKAAYMGEFRFPFPISEDRTLTPNVPWTTIKEIMKAIRARAALRSGGSNAA